MTTQSVLDALAAPPELDSFDQQDTVVADRRGCADVLAIHERRRRLTHSLHLKQAATGLTAQVDRLREMAAAYRTRAIALSSRLSVLEGEHEELRGFREKLAATSARLDHAVAEIDAVTTVERELAVDLR